MLLAGMELLFLVVGASLGAALLSETTPGGSDGALLRAGICEEFRHTAKPDVALQRAQAQLAADPGFYVRARRARGLPDEPAPALEVTAAQVPALLEHGYQLLDVRDVAELSGPLATLPGALHVPIHEIEQGVGSLDRSRAVLVFCKKGLRSACAVERLAALGFCAVSLKGGLQAWHAQGA